VRIRCCSHGANWKYPSGDTSRSGPGYAFVTMSRVEEAMACEAAYREGAYLPFKHPGSKVGFGKESEGLMPTPPAPSNDEPPAGGERGTEGIEVPNGEFCSFIIGKGGAAISQLQKKSGCVVDVMPESKTAGRERAAVRRVQLTGTAQQRYKATALIRERLIYFNRLQAGDREKEELASNSEP